MLTRGFGQRLVERRVQLFHFGTEAVNKCDAQRKSGLLEGFAVIRTDIRTIVKSREQVCEPD
jgi:hypothetical protein